MDKLTRIATLLPILTTLITAVELALPLPKTGAAKLALVKDILLAVDASLSEFWPLLERLITGIVTAYNADGGIR